MYEKNFFYQKYILIYDERKIGTLTVKGTVCGILSDPPGGPGWGGDKMPSPSVILGLKGRVNEQSERRRSLSWIQSIFQSLGFYNVSDFSKLLKIYIDKWI